MAPEVMEGSPYNGKVDVYSYGIVLCEIFSRMLPFSDRYRAFEFIEAVLEQGATPTVPRWCFSGRGAAIRALGLRREVSLWDESGIGGGGGSDSDGEDNPVRQKPLELPAKIQMLRRGTLRKVVLQCLDRDPKQRPSFDHVVKMLRDVLMPEEGAEAAGHLGARVFLEFDLPRIVETMRNSATLLASPPSAANRRTRAAIFSSHLLHGAAVCREVDDLFSAMAQSQRGLPTCSDDHRYMSIQRPALSLTHTMTKQVNDLLANHLIDLLDAVTGWISRNGAIAASYEPVSVLWDVLGAIEALVRMQDPWVNRAHGRAVWHPLERRRQHRKMSRQEARGNSRRGGAAAKVKTRGVVTVLRNAGIVASIIALFALLPGTDEGEEAEEEARVDGVGERGGRGGGGQVGQEDEEDEEDEEEAEENEDYFQDSEQTDDEMLREHLCRAADLGEFGRVFCCCFGCLVLFGIFLNLTHHSPSFFLLLLLSDVQVVPFYESCAGWIRASRSTQRGQSRTALRSSCLSLTRISLRCYVVSKSTFRPCPFRRSSPSDELDLLLQNTTDRVHIRGVLPYRGSNCCGTKDLLESSASYV
jgi:hypothetical protein